MLVPTLVRKHVENMDKPQIIAHVQKNLNYTLFDTKWIPSSAKFVVLGNQPRGTGIVQTYEVSHGDVKLVKEVSIYIHIHFTTMFRL